MVEIVIPEKLDLLERLEKRVRLDIVELLVHLGILGGLGCLVRLE